MGNGVLKLKASKPLVSAPVSGGGGGVPPLQIPTVTAPGGGGLGAPDSGRRDSARSSIHSEKPQSITVGRNSSFDEVPAAMIPTRSAVRRKIDSSTRDFLSGVMKKHFIFATLQDSEFDAVFDALGVCPLESGEIVFNQGDVGDSCYFIQSGTYKISIDGKDLKELGPNDTFGELALLYSMARSATVTCVESGELWQMDTLSFRRCMEKLSSTQTLRAEAFFRSDQNFSGLPQEDKKKLASLCTVQQFSDGEEILRAGEVGNWMFVIISGKAIPTDERLSFLFQKIGCVLGSLGLMYGKLQPTGATAKGNVTCLALARSALAQLTDHVEDVLRRCAFKDLLHSLQRSPDQREFFRFLTEEQQHSLISTAEDGVFEQGEVIASPGDPAQLLLVIDGEVAIVPKIEGPFREEGDLVFIPPGVDVRSSAEQVLSEGMAFGESALVDGLQMPAFAIALGPVRLHRLTYTKALETLGEPITDICRMNEIKKVLSDIFLFKNLREEQIDRVVRRLEQQSFKADEVIVKQGDPAKHFFLIQSGTIVVKKGDATLRTLGRWDYFGERGILLSETRSATCQALEDCVCLSLDDETFFDIVGMFRRELERRMHLQDLNIQMADLQSKAVVGRGTFGVVRLVHPKGKEQTLYALKCVKKWHVVKSNQEKAIVMERDVNAQCYHPCIMQFIKTFQDKSNIYFLTEFLGGGDMFYAIREIGQLSKLQSQFFSGSVCLALEYLHGRGIMYRDLKPENVLLDFKGVAKLVDFGCCKQELRTTTLIGTPEYMAPEVIAGKGYTCVVDWWSLGVMMHEFIVGPLPFGATTDDQMAIFSSILNDQLVIPEYVKDPDAASLLKTILDKVPQYRLGSNGAKELKEQPYYSGFNWDALAGGFFEPPWKPNVEALMKNWEPPDGDLMDHVSKENFGFSKGMEWARTF